MKNTNKNMDMALYARMERAWKYCTNGMDNPFATLNEHEYEWFNFITSRHAREILEFNLPGLDLGNTDNDTCVELLGERWGRAENWTKQWYQYCDRAVIQMEYNFEQWRTHCVSDYLPEEPEEPEETFMGLPDKVTIA